MTPDGRPAPEAPVITIDGPTASGKGTIALGVARALGWRTLDSGALYRTLARAAMTRGVALDDPEALARQVFTACDRRTSELVVPRKVGLLAGLIEWFPDAGRRLLQRLTARG